MIQNIDIHHIQELPTRREVETREITLKNGMNISISIGYLVSNPPKPDEVFVDSGFKEGAEMKFLAQDACILISTLLRVGIAPDVIAEMSSKVSENILGKVQDVYGSMIGVIVAQLLIPRLGFEGEV